MSDFVRSDVMLAFAVMAAVTIASRLGGFWLMGYVNVTPRVRRMLNALPGSIIVAAALPVAINGGPVLIFAMSEYLLPQVRIEPSLTQPYQSPGPYQGQTL